MAIMSNTAVFVRHTHPETQGSHSYSVALVSYDTQEELKALEKQLSCLGTGLPEPPMTANHGYQWYGGRQYDLVATFPSAPDSITPWQEKDVEGSRRSVGDHRYIGHYTAQELLGTEEEEEEEIYEGCGCDCETCMDGRCGEGDCEHAHS